MTVGSKNWKNTVKWKNQSRLKYVSRKKQKKEECGFKENNFKFHLLSRVKASNQIPYALWFLMHCCFQLVHMNRSAVLNLPIEKYQCIFSAY